MKVILKRDEFHELNKEYEVHHIAEDNYGNKRIYLNQHRWVSPSLVESFIDDNINFNAEIEGDNMEITLYELIGMMKDGNPPKIIEVFDETFNYDSTKNDYVDTDNYQLFEDYEWKDELNTVIKILQISIHLEGDQSCSEATDPIKKLPYYDYSWKKYAMEREAYNIKRLDYAEKRLDDYHEKIQELIDKINGM